jgi:hypothetical protein
MILTERHRGADVVASFRSRCARRAAGAEKSKGAGASRHSSAAPSAKDNRRSEISA